jgi:di/tricarboxylate transporter
MKLYYAHIKNQNALFLVIIIVLIAFLFVPKPPSPVTAPVIIKLIIKEMSPLEPPCAGSHLEKSGGKCEQFVKTKGEGNKKPRRWGAPGFGS